MNDIQIPPEAVEAAAMAVHDIDRKIAGEDQWPAWEELSPTDQRRRTHRAKVAIAAALNAWPGAEQLSKTSICISGVDVEISARIILPLDGEA